MKILALIPARGGSKRLPKKNIKLLGGKPLINWTIDVAKGVNEFCDILVSTDDIDIAEVAQKNGAMVPWYRPSNLSTDYSTSVEVTIHALEWYQEHKQSVDGILLLQPTSPFRTVKMVKEGIRLFIDNEMKPVLGVSIVKHHPQWCMKLENKFLTPFVNNHGLNVRSQDLPVAYGLNGYFYLLTPEILMAYRSLIPPGSTPLVIESLKEAWDIDTIWDWKMAEYLLSL